MFVYSPRVSEGFYYDGEIFKNNESPISDAVWHKEEDKHESLAIDKTQQGCGKTIGDLEVVHACMCAYVRACVRVLVSAAEYMSETKTGWSGAQVQKCFLHFTYDVKS